MSIKNIIITILIFLLVIIMSFLGYLIYKDKTAFKKILIKSENKSEKIEKKYPEDLKGKVNLTMREEKSGFWGLYYFDFATNSLVAEKIVENCQIWGGEINFFNTEKLVVHNCAGKGEQIYRINLADESKKITDSSGRWKKEVSWSLDGDKVVFMAASPEDENVEMEDWQIFISDLEGEEKFIANAVHPFFSPDGEKILALKKEGLFLFDIKNQTEKNVHTFKTEVPISLQLGLSSKRDLLAVANPVDREIIIFKINSWDDFQMEEINKIETKNTYVSWPKFDPNSDKYIITEEVYDDGGISLIVYNLESKERYFIEDLTFYRHDYLWINDWK